MKTKNEDYEGSRKKEVVRRLLATTCFKHIKEQVKGITLSGLEWKAEEKILQFFPNATFEGYERDAKVFQIMSKNAPNGCTPIHMDFPFDDIPAEFNVVYPDLCGFPTKAGMAKLDHDSNADDVARILSMSDPNRTRVVAVTFNLRVRQLHLRDRLEAHLLQNP